MTTKTRIQLENAFQTGSVPKASDFADLFQSSINFQDDNFEINSQGDIKISGNMKVNGNVILGEKDSAGNNIFGELTVNKVSINEELVIQGTITSQHSQNALLIQSPVMLSAGVQVNEFSADPDLGISDTSVPTQKAVKSYADSKANLAGNSSQDFAANNLTVNSSVSLSALAMRNYSVTDITNSKNLSVGSSVTKDKIIPTAHAVQAHVADAIDNISYANAPLTVADPVNDNDAVNRQFLLTALENQRQFFLSRVIRADGSMYESGKMVLNGFGVIYDTPDNEGFTVPLHVKQLHIVAIGGGGGGGGGTYAGAGGGGGGLATVNNMPVTPGQVFLIEIGAGGLGSFSSNNGRDGSASIVRSADNNIELLIAGAGAGGKHAESEAIAEGGEGGDGFVHQSIQSSYAIGRGGKGGSVQHETLEAGGGGGAGGYNGNGGYGGDKDNGGNGQAGVNGAGGGGGGSTNHDSVAGIGGGTGPFGKILNGDGKMVDDVNGLAGNAGSQHFLYNEVFGGGGAGADSVTAADPGAIRSSSGQNGVVMISWGELLVF